MPKFVECMRHATSQLRPVIALTGATGFIGSFLLRELLREGYSVRVLLRRPALLPTDCTNAVIGDLERPINMGAALAGVYTIIHSAGLASQMTGTPEKKRISGG